MTREIKFRAWDKKENKMWGKAFPKMFIADDSFGFTNDELYEIMQYTGLKDKNGKEIYEWDILEEGSWIGWCNKCCGFQPMYEYENTEECHRCEGNYEIGDIIKLEKIIGNIYENPELLK